MTKLRISGLINDSIVDGPGIRYVIFTQGCPHACLGCHNPKTHDLNGGRWTELDSILEEIDQNPLLDGVTLSGGEPLLQAKACLELVQKIKERQLHILVYTGYTYEELMALNNPDIMSLLQYVDVLIDGRYVQEQKSLSLLFKGSANQRIINVQESLRLGNVVEYYVDSFGNIQ